MGRIWVTSDTHFGHNKEFLYGPRGFKTIQEHDKELIQNWNMLIKPEDDVYLLGDLMLQDNIHGRECIEQLNGKLHIALGNHDSYNREQIYSTFSNVVEVNRLFLIKYRKWQFYCCHFPVLLDNFDEKRKLYCLHGHTHNPDRFQYINHCCYNVNPEAHNNLPVSLEQIVEEIRNKQYST